MNYIDMDRVQVARGRVLTLLGKSFRLSHEGGGWYNRLDEESTRTNGYCRSNDDVFPRRGAR